MRYSRPSESASIVKAREKGRRTQLIMMNLLRKRRRK